MAALDEENAVLSVIFGDDLEDSWRDDPEFVQYVSELTGYGVDRLSREGDHLNEEKRHIDKQTEDLAFNNYKTFIQTANCTSDIFKDFQIIESNLTALQDKLPEFSTECQTFMDTAHSITQSRKSNSLTLQKHTQLLEILEVPQLMDTCVRNGYYDEALELSAYVRRLEKKHSNIAVIMMICEEVKHCTQLLLSQLLQQLRSDIQLPACLRVIGFLRHMDIFTEAELRLKFLQARDTWFQGVLANIPKADAYQHLSKVIEVSRVHLFDIITQYRAIFTDDETSVKPSLGFSTAPRESLLLQSWVQSKVEQFTDTLKADLERGMAGRLDSLLGQCMYFGLSFSRVGCDFRGLLANIFQEAALESFIRAVMLANEKYDKNMETYTLVLRTSHQSSMSSSMSGRDTSLSPPQSLLQFTPLALYCNDILSAFNDLRVCAPINVTSDVTKTLERSLSKVADVISNFHRLEHESFTAAEQDTFKRMCELFSIELLPYMNRCLQVLFPPSNIAKILGVTIPQLQSQHASIYMLDVLSITEPLKAFLPADVEIATATAATSHTEEHTDDKAAVFHLPASDDDEYENGGDAQQTSPRVDDENTTTTATAAVSVNPADSADLDADVPQVSSAAATAADDQAAADDDIFAESDD